MPADQPSQTTVPLRSIRNWKPDEDLRKAIGHITADSADDPVYRQQQAEALARMMNRGRK